MASANNFTLGIGLAALAAMLAFGQTNAQPHMRTPKWEDVAGPPTEPDVWLRRLVGRYRFEGMVQVLDECARLVEGEELVDMTTERCTGVKGVGDCVAIGSGPGVQCMLNVTWVELWDQSDRDVKPVAMSYLDPAMILIGLDPGKSALNYMLVNRKGLTEAGLGFISGNRATFKNTLCATRSYHCVPSMYFEARPDAEVLYARVEYLADDINTIDDTPFPNGGAIVMTLRRIRENEKNEAPPKQSLSR